MHVKIFPIYNEETPVHITSRMSMVSVQHSLQVFSCASKDNYFIPNSPYKALIGQLCLQPAETTLYELNTRPLNFICVCG